MGRGTIRDDGAAYDRYLAGMDASMRQKVALTAAHLLCVGDCADMGSGSGGASAALAGLYPDLDVVGVDLDPEMVRRASAAHPLPNLRFQEGDVAAACFPPGTVEAILDSSVLHHVTSFGGYRHEAAREALEVQAHALAPDGVLIVRDFVAPEPEDVWLEVPADDGEGDAPETCSSAALLERFAREFRGLHHERGFALRPVGCDRPGWRRYLLAARHAVEFVLRKDYRADWEREVEEEYTYATLGELAGWMEQLGLRVLACTPVRNPWIVRNRFVGRFRWGSGGAGGELDWPATNAVVVGQRVAPGAGTVLRPAGPRAPGGYLEHSHFVRQGTGQVYDLVRRPGTTVDVVPWYAAGGSLFVLGRRGYPRPIVALGGVGLDGTVPVTWLSEPMHVLQGDKPIGQTVAEGLARFPGLRLLRMAPGPTSYPSPGGLQEEVRVMLVEVEPVSVDHPLEVDNGFTSAGTLRAIEACQLLRAAQVGGLPDARLEMSVYALLDGRSPGPWIGAAIDLAPSEPVEVTAVSALRARVRRRAWEPTSRAAGFLELACEHFEELDASGETVGGRVLEYVRPRGPSAQTLVTAPLCLWDGRVLLGVDLDDLPAAQCFTGNSDLLVAPAWRLPYQAATGIRRSRAWLSARMAQDYGVEITRSWDLGGRWHPSPGVTPETAWPVAVEVRPAGVAGRRRLVWVPLADLLGAPDLLVDGHLRVVAFRAAHALGILEGRTA